MNSTVIVAIIGAAGAALAGAFSYWYTDRQKQAARWRRLKLKQCKELLLAISEVAADKRGVDSCNKLAHASNSICLTASQSVVRELMEYNRAIIEGWLPNLHEAQLTALVLAIRKDLGVQPEDDPKTFIFRLVARGRNNPPPA